MVGARRKLREVAESAHVRQSPADTMQRCVRDMFRGMLRDGVRVGNGVSYGVG